MKATHELLGEEYACDDEWVLVTIMKGTKKACNSSKKSLLDDVQYRNMAVYKIEEGEE